LTDTMREAAEARAAQLGRSLGGFIKDALVKELARLEALEGRVPRRRKADRTEAASDAA
jgi:hypothetical protein